MADDSYSKIDADFRLNVAIKPITDHLMEQDKTLGAILTQVKTTNGRVTALERVRTGVYWGGSVLIAAAVVVSGLIVYIWNIQTEALNNVVTEVQTLESVKNSLSTTVNNESK